MGDNAVPFRCDRCGALPGRVMLACAGRGEGVCPFRVERQRFGLRDLPKEWIFGSVVVVAVTLMLSGGIQFIADHVLIVLAAVAVMWVAAALSNMCVIL